MRGMISRRVVGILGVIVACGTPADAESVIGSATIFRDHLDSSVGLTLIYRGATQPYVGDGGTATTFSIFANTLGGTWVTPFLLESDGVGSYTVVAIGQSVQPAAIGSESFDFASIAGAAQTLAGKTYSFGYQNARYQTDGTGGVARVAGSATSGAIPFTGYGITLDPWSYASASELYVGQIYGDGGVALDFGGLTGRVYSANLSFVRVPTPGSLALSAVGGLCLLRRRVR